MPIKGTIEADYSKFEAECAKAEEGLAKIEKQGQATGQSLEKMESSVATGKINDAIAKTVVNVDKVGASARASGSSFGVMAQGLQVADKTLNQFGVNLGPTIGSLQELSQISTAASGSIGMLGKATAITAGIMAAWQITKKFRELTDADRVIADMWSTMMGWGSVISEEMGAKMDVVRKAIRDGYEGIPTFDQALKFNTERLKENSAQSVTSANLVNHWSMEIEKAKGGADALRAEIEAGNMTVEQMVARFHVSAEAIAYFTRVLKDEKDALAESNREQEKATREADAHAKAIQSLQDAMFGTDKIAKVAEYQAALGNVENLTRMSTDAQKQMNTTLGEAWDAYTRMGQVAPQAMRDLYMATMPLPPIVAGLGAEWANVGEKVSVATESIVGDLKKQADAHKKMIADFEAETQRQVDAWNRGERATDSAKQSLDETAGSAQRLTVQMQQLTTQMTAYEAAIAKANLLSAYAKAGVATSGSIGLGGADFAQLQRTGVPGGWGGVGWAQSQPASGQPWGNQNTLNVNVNNADAGRIAEKLVGEMKHQGYRL